MLFGGLANDLAKYLADLAKLAKWTCKKQLSDFLSDLAKSAKSSAKYYNFFIFKLITSFF